MDVATSWWFRVVLTMFIIGGCSTSGTRVTLEPSPGRSEASVRADSDRCAEMASAVTSAVQSIRDREYVACLVAQGYRVTVPFRAGLEHARLTLSSPTTRPATAVAADLAACQEAVSAGRVGAAEIVAGQIGGAHTGDSLQVRPHTSDSHELANQLLTCLNQRGYDAKR